MSVMDYCQDQLDILSQAERELATAEGELDNAWEKWHEKLAEAIAECGIAALEGGLSLLSDIGCLYRIEQTLEEKWEVELAQQNVAIAEAFLDNAQRLLDECLECYHD